MAKNSTSESGQLAFDTQALEPAAITEPGPVTEEGSFAADPVAERGLFEPTDGKIASRVTAGTAEDYELFDTRDTNYPKTSAQIREGIPFQMPPPEDVEAAEVRRINEAAKRVLKSAVPGTTKPKPVYGSAQREAADDDAGAQLAAEDRRRGREIREEPETPKQREFRLQQLRAATARYGGKAAESPEQATS